jgi:hypothetical protein
MQPRRPWAGRRIEGVAAPGYATGKAAPTSKRLNRPTAATSSAMARSRTGTTVVGLAVASPLPSL